MRNAQLDDGNISETQEGKDLLSILYSNRSSALLLNGQPNSALKDAESCILLNSRWPKAYYRAAAASMALNNTEDAARFIESALLLSPTDSDIKKLHLEIHSKKPSTYFQHVDSGVYSWGCGNVGQLGCVILPLQKPV